MDADGWVKKNCLKYLDGLKFGKIKLMVQEVGRLIIFLGVDEHHKQYVTFFH
jgi:hypothetical protein